jgi:hypothetical protein
MANKPSYSSARKARGTATMSIEPMPEKKSFSDDNLEQGYGAGGANGFSDKPAKPGAGIVPELKATPKMALQPPDKLSKT